MKQFLILLMLLFVLINSFAITTETESFDYNSFTGANTVEVNVIAYVMILIGILGVIASIVLYLKRPKIEEVGL